MRIILLACVCLLVAGESVAQTRPVVRVFGTGAVVIEQPGPDLATVQSYVHKVYIGTQAPVTLTNGVCGVAGTSFECAYPLAQIPLTSSPATLSITASLSAADGSGESDRFVLPFDLQKLARPAPPGPSASVRPGS